jgi:hypothetical protein
MHAGLSVALQTVEAGQYRLWLADLQARCSGAAVSTRRFTPAAEHAHQPRDGWLAREDAHDVGALLAAAAYGKPHVAPPDAAVLGEARGARAKVFVTGDAALFAAGIYGDIPILSPRQFWELPRRPP